MNILPCSWSTAGRNPASIASAMEIERTDPFPGLGSRDNTLTRSLKPFFLVGPTAAGNCWWLPPSPPGQVWHPCFPHRAGGGHLGRPVQEVGLECPVERHENLCIPCYTGQVKGYAWICKTFIQKSCWNLERVISTCARLSQFSVRYPGITRCGGYPRLS